MHKLATVTINGKFCVTTLHCGVKEGELTKSKCSPRLASVLAGQQADWSSAKGVHMRMNQLEVLNAHALDSM